MAGRYPQFRLAPYHRSTGLEYWCGYLWPFRLSLTDLYQVQVRYQSSGDPRIFVMDPLIDRTTFPGHPHLYQDGAICSYYPGDETWVAPRDDVSILVDMAAGWLVQHVCWRWFGVWPGPEVRH